MNGNLSQQVALVSFGNEFLKTKIIDDNFYPNNSTFQYCNSVEFMDFKKAFFSSKVKEVSVANNPIEWFKFLRNEGCKKLALNFQHSKDQSFAPDYKLAGFVGGGGSWLIEAIYNNYSNYWADKWEVTNKEAADRKIWGVKYGVIAKTKPITDMHYDLIETRNSLDAILLEIKELATRHNLDNWVNIFQKAHNTLESPIPNLEYYHDDLIITKNYPLAARQLLFAAGLAFVFGGMGSWNDLAFEMGDESETYRSLSSKLYDEINKSIIASVNNN